MLSNSNHIFNWYTYIATIGTYDIAHSDEMLHRKKKKKKEDIFVGKNIPKLQIMWNNAEKVKLHKKKQKTNKQTKTKTKNNNHKTKQDMLATPH